MHRERSEEELGALQKYGFGNQRCGVFARLQVSPRMLSEPWQKDRKLFLHAAPPPLLPLAHEAAGFMLSVLTGGAERRDRPEEPRGSDGRREEARAARRGGVRLLPRPLPVSLLDQLTSPLPPCCLLTSLCHFRADLFEDSEIKELLKFRPWWDKLSPTEQGGQAGEFKSYLHDTFFE